jgi:hypothetical protein
VDQVGRSPKLTVAFSQSSYILTTYRVVRWGVARHNSISGISDAARYRNATAPQCGGVKVNSDRSESDPNVWPTDMVTEHNTLVCPSPGVLPGTNGTLVLGGCNHCAIE